MKATDVLSWNDAGLVPAVALDAETGRFLMLAWMNLEAYEKTLASGLATFYSRSRQKLWTKGESSGNALEVESVRIDCDGDTIVLEVRPRGPACHTGKSSCAYRSVGNDGELLEDDGPLGAAAAIVDNIYRVALERKESDAGKSYTKSLFDGGWPKILAKLAEEHGELADELPSGPDDAAVHESADLLFHWLVALAAREIEPSRVWAELERRFGTGGHQEKRGRSKQ